MLRWWWRSNFATGDGEESHLFRTDRYGDGMDDAWELAYFGTLDRDGTDDIDGDCASDLTEFCAGTDPTNQAPSCAP